MVHLKNLEKKISTGTPVRSDKNFSRLSGGAPDELLAETGSWTRCNVKKYKLIEIKKNAK